MRTVLSLGLVSTSLSLFLFAASACSSFTTADASPPGDAAPGADATVVEDASVRAREDAAADPPTDAGLSLAQAIAPERVMRCDAWTAVHSASFDLVAGGGPATSVACRLCRTDTANTAPFAQLELPTLPGTYSITAQARLAGPMAITWGVGFKHGDTEAARARSSRA